MKKLLLAFLSSVAALSATAFSTDTIQVNTTYLDSPENVTVIVPDNDGTQRFPVVYLLNGYSGSHRTWGNIRRDLGQLADQYGFLIIMPDGRDSWYWDSPINPGMQMESFITKDLVSHIDNNYPTIPAREKRAITGLSMGGHGAMWLAGRHPDIFGSVGSTSGGVDIRPFPTRWKMAQRIGKLEDNPEVWDNYTVATMVPAFKDAKLNIIFDCGTSDFFYDVNLKLHHDMLEAGIPHDFISRPGAHKGEYWNNSILYQLLFFDQAFNKE